MFSLVFRSFAVALMGAGLLLASSGCRALKPVVALPIVPAPAAPVLNIQPPSDIPVSAPPKSAADNMATNLLAWDALEQQHAFKAGETNANFTFHLKNTSPEPIVIYDASASCDCTVAKLPVRPWTIPAGGSGRIEASIDFQKRKWSMVNYIVVFTSKGNRMLTVRVTVPPYLVFPHPASPDSQNPSHK